jgi:hypothetical protein
MAEVMAKEDMVEGVRALYGNGTAEQVKQSPAVTLVEIVVVDHRGGEYLLNPITKAK